MTERPLFETSTQPRTFAPRPVWRAILAAGLALAGLGVLAASCGGSPLGDCTVGGTSCALGCAPNVGCSECSGDADCHPGEPFCVLGQCVACRQDSDCGAGQACYLRHHQCDTKCTTNSNCPGDSPFCEPMTGACVGCRTDADCGGDHPICEPTRGQCSACSTNSNCGAAEPICDLQEGECRQCLVDGDCQSGYLCGGDHKCHAGCKVNNDCEGDRPICNPETGACVGCVDNGDCGTAAPTCRPDGRCVQCLSNANCAAPTPNCDDHGFCAQCTADAQCPVGMKCKGEVCTLK